MRDVFPGSRSSSSPAGRGRGRRGRRASLRARIGQLDRRQVERLHDVELRDDAAYPEEARRRPRAGRGSSTMTSSGSHRSRSDSRSQRYDDVSATNSEEEVSRCLPPSPERSATSPSSATAESGRPRSSRRCSSRRGRRTGSARSSRARPSPTGTTTSTGARCRSRATLFHLDWQDRKINLVDMPGDAGFQADTYARAARGRGRARRSQRRHGRGGEHRARLGARGGVRAVARRVREHARPRARRLLPRARGRARRSSPTAASPSSCRSAPSTS